MTIDRTLWWQLVWLILLAFISGPVIASFLQHPHQIDNVIELAIIAAAVLVAGIYRWKKRNAQSIRP